MDKSKDAASPEARDERATGPNTVGDKGGRLGASDHVGQPRMYAESAVEKLEEDPLPETPPGGSKDR